MIYNITNTDTPLKTVTPSENPVWYSVEGIPTGTPLTYGYTYIQSLGGVYDFKNNDYITFVDNWGNTVSFSWVTTSNFATAFSNNSRYVIGGNNPALYNLYLNSFITAFNNSVLSAHFNAVLDTSVSPARIKINNLVPGLGGSVLALGGTFPTIAGGSIYEAGVVLGSVPYSPQDDYQSPYTIGRVFTNNEAPFPSLADYSAPEIVGELVKAYIGGDTLNFDPSAVLRTIVNTKLPTLDTAMFQDEQLKRYWIEYGTGGYYGINANTTFDGDITQIRWILNASQPLEYDTNLTPYWKNALNPCEGDIVKCLTNSPNRGISRTPVVFSKNPLLLNQREFLSFICEIVGPLSINYEVRYAYGVTISGNKPILDTLGNPINSQIGVNTVDVSPSYLDFMTLPDEIIDYTLAIVVGTTPYTERRYYYIINNCLPSRTQIMFLNRLGGWDTFYFTGDNNTKDSRKSELYNRTLPVTPNPFNRGSNQFNIDYVRGLDLSSQQLTSNEFIWLEELLGSNDVYIINSKGEFESVILTDFKRDFSSTKQLYTIDITVQKSMSTNNVNNTGISGTLPYVPPFIP